MWKEIPRMFAVALKFYNSSKTCRHRHSCENWESLRPTRLSKFKAAGFFRHRCEHLRQVVRVLAIVVDIVVRKKDTV